ncbi:hypothetical protein I3843_15G100800 [Carya illinoinensis]|nr:hypothetical protein I3843_15G100800 [Carya illinoinensis]
MFANTKGGNVLWGEFGHFTHATCGVLGCSQTGATPNIYSFQILAKGSPLKKNAISRNISFVLLSPDTPPPPPPRFLSSSFPSPLLFVPPFSKIARAPLLHPFQPNSISIFATPPPPHFPPTEAEPDSISLFLYHLRLSLSLSLSLSFYPLTSNPNPRAFTVDPLSLSTADFLWVWCYACCGSSWSSELPIADPCRCVTQFSKSCSVASHL